MRLKKKAAALLLGTAGVAFLALTTACTADAASPAPADASEAPEDPDATFYVVAFHWGWAAFDQDGRELDGIRVRQGTTVEIYAVNDAAGEAIGRLPAAVSAAINAIEWDGERTRGEIAEGRLPDPQVTIGMRLEDVMGHDDDADDAHAEDAETHDEKGEAAEGADAHGEEGEAADEPMPDWQMPWHGEGELETHGFLIQWYGVAKKLEPDAGEPVRVVFTADRPGAYEFECVVYCGYGHKYQKRDMLFVEAAA